MSPGPAVTPVTIITKDHYQNGRCMAPVLRVLTHTSARAATVSSSPTAPTSRVIS
jgi:hypothetical protein